MAEFSVEGHFPFAEIVRVFALQAKEGGDFRIHAVESLQSWYS